MCAVSLMCVYPSSIDYQVWVYQLQSKCVYIMQCLSIGRLLISNSLSLLFAWVCVCGVPQEPEGLVYKLGTDIHSIEHILVEKLTRFQAQESHQVPFSPLSSLPPSLRSLSLSISLSLPPPLCLPPLLTRCPPLFL